MLHQIQRWLTGGSRTAAAAEGLAGPRAAGLAVEPLEAREVLAGEPVGTEFQINTFTNSPQQTFNESPGAVASDSNGNYVVVWASDLQDGSGFGVYGQRFNSSGVAQGAEFRVNSSTIGDQKWATVAMDSSGDFVVTWTSAGQDGGGYGVFAQRYNAAGVALGGEFQVNTTVASDQKWSTVAMDSTGNFVITWTAVGQDGFGQGVYAAQFTAAGVAVGGEFRVNTVTVGNQQRSAVAMDADGDYAIVWQSYGQDASSYGIFGQRYSKSNVPVGAEFQVNTTTTSQQIGPSIAMDSSGDFVVAWTGYTDGNGYGAFFQRFNASGVPQGFETAVNTYTTASQNAARVAIDSDGDFVVTWTSYGQDTFFGGVYGQRFNASGVAQGLEFQINTFTTFGQSASSVAMDSDGDFVVVWQSNAQDGNGYGVYGQRYRGSGTGTTTPQTPIGTAVVATDPVDSSKQSLFITSTSGNDTIKIAMKSAGYVVKINTYTYTTPFVFDGRVYVNSLAGNDTVSVDYKATAQFVIDGGDGSDKLYGGRANDILIGGAGNDYLNGQGGKDLLIGGLGADKLYGQGTGSSSANEGNLMIGDSTDFDGNLTALTSILAAWQINDQATVRTFLDSTTVNNDGASDYIRSASKGVDWAFSFELKSTGKRLDNIVFGSADLIN